MGNDGVPILGKSHWFALELTPEAAPWANTKGKDPTLSLASSGEAFNGDCCGIDSFRPAPQRSCCAQALFVPV